MDASEIYSKRLNARKVVFPTENGKLLFQSQIGRIKLPGGDQDLRTSTSIQQRPIQGERSWKRWTHRKSTRKDSMQGRWHFPKKMENLFSSRRWTNQTSWRRSRLENVHLDTVASNSRRRELETMDASESTRKDSMQERSYFPLPDAGEAINDFWSMSGNFIYRHHVEPRVKLYSPREESFPIPLKYIDVSRTTHTNLDVMQESRIDDHWNIDGSRDLSGSWTGFTQITVLSEKPLGGYTKRQATSRPDHLWPQLWRGMSKNANLREKHEWAIE